MWVFPVMSICAARAEFSPQLRHFLAMGPQASYLIPLCLSFLICKLGILTQSNEGMCVKRTTQGLTDGECSGNGGSCSQSNSAVVGSLLSGLELVKNPFI